MVNALAYKDIPLSTADPEVVLSAYIENDYVQGSEPINRPAVLIFPGTEEPFIGDQHVDLIASEFTLRGFHAFVLHRSLKALTKESTLFIEAGFSAIAWIRGHAKEWNVDAERIVVCGFSESIPLAEGLMTLWKDALLLEKVGYAPQHLRPDAGILIRFFNSQSSPEEVTTPNSAAQRVDCDTPPAFIWCQSAGSTSSENRLAGKINFDLLTTFATALLQNGRPAELHIFGENTHGYSLAVDRSTLQKSERSTCEWLEPAERWLRGVLELPIQGETLSIKKTGEQDSDDSLPGINRKPIQYYRNIFNDRERMFQHTPFSLEQDLVRNVINGDERAALSTISEIYRRGNRAVLAKDPLRSVKNSMICFITLLTRAVIQAGVSDEEAFSLSDAAIQHIETLYDPETVLDYKDPVVVQFIHLVKTRQDRNYSVTIRKAIHYITSNLEKPFQLAAVAEYACVHPNYLSRRFKDETGTTLSDFVTTRKIYEATYFIQHTDYSIAEIAALYGFSSQSHFGRAFKKVLFISPGDYRNRGK